MSVGCGCFFCRGDEQDFFSLGTLTVHCYNAYQFKGLLLCLARVDIITKPYKCSNMSPHETREISLRTHTPQKKPQSAAVAAKDSAAAAASLFSIRTDYVAGAISFPAHSAAAANCVQGDSLIPRAFEPPNHSNVKITLYGDGKKMNVNFVQQQLPGLACCC